MANTPTINIGSPLLTFGKTYLRVGVGRVKANTIKIDIVQIGQCSTYLRKVNKNYYPTIKIDNPEICFSETAINLRDVSGRVFTPTVVQYVGTLPKTPGDDTFLIIFGATVQWVYSITLNSVQFTDESFGQIASWYWTFGDGEFSTEQHPLHEYDDSGVYYVTLAVTYTSGETGTKSRYITIINVPTNSQILAII